MVGPVVVLLWSAQDFLSEDTRRATADLLDVLFDLAASVGTLLWLASLLGCWKVVPTGKRGLWFVVLVLANVFALPFFWFWYVRPYLSGTPVAA